MTAVATPYRLVADADKDGQRIIAVTPDDIEICGAYRPLRLNDWRLYVTKLMSDVAGLPQPHKVHVVSRSDAIRWVDLLAALYARAVLR
ncbi:hypothetical protein MSP7336_01835 [Mycobacterium shimoidei]|uniref:Uncharacterized protein n=1 Tax=Mycobacterium shimoidei TaxID=29313 RepID=A0A375YXK2_MYCSH|nr:hypothetical protein [Mycobacterium shimoidei]SRX93596.1 hypothetical protein MSP7336_01835 [Mycobacterium shimoidei]